MNWDIGPKIDRFARTFNVRWELLMLKRNMVGPACGSTVFDKLRPELAEGSSPKSERDFAAPVD
jgi:hypothetical protein